MRVPGRRLSLMICVGLAAYLATICAAQSNEYQVKAAYLYNFAKMAQWPVRVLPTDSPLIIGVFGGDEEFVNVARGVLSGKTVNGHAFEVRHVRSPEELKVCQIAFFRESEKNTPAVISQLTGSNILLVGEEKQFLDHGGMINLILANGRITYELNSAALERSGISYTNSSSPSAKAGADSAGIELEGYRPIALRVPPSYPRIAATMKLKGTVQVEAVVRADGSVKEVHIVGGHPILAQAALEAVRQWRYQAAAKETTELVKISFGE